MTSTKPYLLRAIYEWSLDNELTPQVLVDATAEGVEVPTAYVKDGQILLNVHPQAVEALNMDNEYVAFGARFGGVHHNVLVPVRAALAIFARENGQGIFFQPDDDDTAENQSVPGGPRAVDSSDATGSDVVDFVDPVDSPDDDPKRPGGGRPNLRLVD